MAIIDEFKSWFERDIRGATWDENVKVDESDPEKIEIRFYTDTNEYAFAISTLESEAPIFDAVVTPRKARAGQADARGRPMIPSGKFRLNEKMWRRILGNIVGLELVRVQQRSGSGHASETDDPRRSWQSRSDRSKLQPEDAAESELY